LTGTILLILQTKTMRPFIPGAALVLLSSTIISGGLQAQPSQRVAQGNNLTVSVNLSGLTYPVEKVFLSYYNTLSKVRFTDSIVVSGQQAVNFQTSLDEPILAQLYVVPSAQNSQQKGRTAAKDNFSIYLEPGKIKVTATDSFSNATVTGSPSHLQYLALKKDVASYDKYFTALYARYGEARKAKDAAAESRVRKQIDSLQNTISEGVYKKFISQYGKSSPVAIYALLQYSGYAIDPVKVEPAYNLLGAPVKGLPSGKLFEERIAIAKQLQIGKKAILFTQNDTADAPVNLASFKGKYVLIDFWASWCGPCRAENPNVVSAFNKYKDKNFTVLGVSLDRPGQKDKWLKAIHDDKLAWTHVSDLKFWDNEVAKLYDIKAIPQNVLLDNEGKIIAKNIRGEELQTKLQELFK
jgi:peroxiredoxin